jgi:hypothetical protein
VLINWVDSKHDGGNYEQMVANAATCTAAAKWTLSLACMHDATITGGANWELDAGGNVLATKAGPISSA